MKTQSSEARGITSMSEAKIKEINQGFRNLTEQKIMLKLLAE